jgi:hypothetical protein
MFTFEEVSSSIFDGIEPLIHRIEAFHAEEPWSLLEPEARLNALPTLVDLTCALALRRSSESGLCRRMLESAAFHGYSRRQQGLPEFTLLREMSLVRQGIWSDLQVRYGDEGDVVATIILRIDRAFTLASQASMRGYFRPEFEGQGTWPGAITDLEREWSELALPGGLERRHFRGRRRKGRSYRLPGQRTEVRSVLPPPPSSTS